MKTLFTKLTSLLNRNSNEELCPVQLHLEEIDFKINHSTYTRLIELLNEDLVGTVAITNVQGEYITLRNDFPIHMFYRWVDKNGCARRISEHGSIKPSSSLISAH